jgi:hypothetical protein
VTPPTGEEKEIEEGEWHDFSEVVARITAGLPAGHGK